jgi:hypothetical protein
MDAPTPPPELDPVSVSAALDRAGLRPVLARAAQQAFVQPLLEDLAEAAALAELTEPVEPPSSWPCTSVRLWAESSATDTSRFREPVSRLVAPPRVSRFEDAASSWLSFELDAGQVTSVSLHHQHSVARRVALSEAKSRQALQRYQSLFDQLSFVAYCWLELQLPRLRRELGRSSDAAQGLRHRLVALDAESKLLGLCFTPAHRRTYSARLRAATAAALLQASALLVTEMGLTSVPMSDKVSALTEQARVGLHYLEPFATATPEE